MASWKLEVFLWDHGSFKMLSDITGGCFQVHITSLKFLPFNVSGKSL